MDNDLPRLADAVLEPAPPPVIKPRPVKLIEIIWTMNDEAERIENAQNALVMAGMRKEPHPGQMDRAHVLRSGANVLATLEPDWDSVRAWISEKRRKGRRG